MTAPRPVAATTGAAGPSDPTGSDDGWESVVDRLVGVLDLRHGIPVHAVAGHRSDYRPLIRQISGHRSPQRFDATGLLSAYRDFGIRHFYVADLDGILDRNPRWDRLGSVVERLRGDETVTIDVGWRGDEPSSPRARLKRLAGAGLAAAGPNLRWVAASESSRGLSGPRGLADLVGAENVSLGMDYRAGRWLGDEGESVWIEEAVSGRYGGMLVLDLAGVGGQGGPVTVDRVRRLRKLAGPSGTFRIDSGGGIRDVTDTRRLMGAGCHGCLVATAVHRLVGVCGEPPRPGGPSVTVRSAFRNARS